MFLQFTGKNWRRGRDSNPRDAYATSGFQDRRIQPLCHPSINDLRKINLTQLAKIGKFIGRNRLIAMKTNKTKNKMWPPIHELTYTSGKRVWQVACMVDGQRIREVFESKEAAELHAAKIRRKVTHEGAAAFSLSPSIQIDAQAAVDQLKEYPGETIAKAVEFYISHNLRFRQAPPIREIIKEFVAEREKLNQRERNLEDVRYRLAVFARSFGDRKLAEIDVEELATWLRDPTWGARSQIHYRRRVSMLYDYAIKHRYCDVNTAALLENPEVEDKDIECFSVEECTRILANAQKANCLPLVVLSLFAGLRRAEIVRLDWSNVNLAERTITVGSKAAKKRSRRVITINDTAAAWLTICAKLNGPVIAVSEETIDVRLKNLVDLAGLSRWRKNGLRHCFCTYHLAAGKDPVRTAYEAGNSAEVIKRCYDALASEATAKRFWDLRPSSNADEKIVPMKQASNQ